MKRRASDFACKDMIMPPRNWGHYLWGNAMAELASFWVGGQLGPVEIASLRSFRRYGHPVTIYSPSRMDDLPEGVIWGDASEIMPSQKILLHWKSQSPALHSDLFRYQLIEKTDKIWVDLDVVALRPLDFDTEWVFGYETPGEVNGAVLRLPKSSLTLKALLKIGPDTRGIPPYLTGFRRAKYWAKGFGRGLSIDRWPWGSIGPRLLTYYLSQFDEIQHARSISAFYSVPIDNVAKFAEPHGLTRDDLPTDAWAVHLWGSKLRKVLEQRYSGQPPKDSFLDLALRDAL